MGKSFQYGGQAVIEGVMMRGPDMIALAVRKPGGDIVVETEPSTPPGKKHKIFSWPLIRGTVILIDLLVQGVRALNRSAVLVTEGEEEELNGKEIFLTVLAAFVLATALFIALPTGLVHFTKSFIGGVMVQNLVEGTIRIIVFVGYVLAIAGMPDIKRVFMYHGAEHKAVHTLEAGLSLIPENTQSYSTLHPRCGTSFLLIVMVISIFVFALLGEGSLWWRVGSRLLALPIVAGLGYEFIKLTSRYSHQVWAKILMAPGLWLQKITTREPDDQQVEVALAALNAVVRRN